MLITCGYTMNLLFYSPNLNKLILAMVDNSEIKLNNNKKYKEER